VTVLFGLIAITGARIWVDNRVDFTRGVNLFIAGVVVIIGAADYTLQIGDFQLGGIGLGTFGAIILYQLFRHAAGGLEAGPSAEAVTSDSSDGELVPIGADGGPGPSVAS
jgi:xanthine/uracil permease